MLSPDTTENDHSAHSVNFEDELTVSLSVETFKHTTPSSKNPRSGGGLRDSTTAEQDFPAQIDGHDTNMQVVMSPKPKP